MPIARLPREDVFMPVTTKMIISISEIICVPNIVSIPEIASIWQLPSHISLVPRSCSRWISVIRELGQTPALTRLPDVRHCVWT
jgi:hypothetical protein